MSMFFVWFSSSNECALGAINSNMVKLLDMIQTQCLCKLQYLSISTRYNYNVRLKELHIQAARNKNLTQLNF